MTYVDGFVIAVPSDKQEAYRALAESASHLFKEYGALTVVECWGDDLPEGKVNSFHTAVMRKPEENVVFSWITWPDKETRDRGMEKALADPRMTPDLDNLPFDGTRMIYGGFRVIVSA